MYKLPIILNETVQHVSDTLAAETDYKKPQFYLKNLPLKDSLINILTIKIATAMLNAGKAYAERIPDTTKQLKPSIYLLTDFLPVSLFLKHYIICTISIKRE